MGPRAGPFPSIYSPGYDSQPLIQPAQVSVPKSRQVLSLSFRPHPA